MRSRTSLYALLLIAGSLALPLAAHAAIPFFGPIVPTAYNVCPASWGLLVTIINNLISLLITIAIVFIAPLMIAYAGFLFVVNPVDPSGISKAKGILVHTLVGIVVALAGWMIVDAIMAVLYNPSAAGGTWSSLITSGGIQPCIPLRGSLSQTPSGELITGVSATGRLNPPPADNSGAACDPAAVKAAAAVGGFDLSVVQANTLACIALPESSCGSNIQNYAWNTGVPGKPGSTAYGAFQVLLQTNSNCYENKACYAAAGLPESGSTLNCSTGFTNGNPKVDSKGIPLPVVQQCMTAAASLNCSASAAACLLKQNGGSFSPWQKDVNSAKQSGCINSGG